VLSPGSYRLLLQYGSSSTLIDTSAFTPAVTVTWRIAPHVRKRETRCRARAREQDAA